MYSFMLNNSNKFGLFWKYSNWRKFREKLGLFQFQIFNSIKYKNFKKALFQQKSLLLSSEIYWLSIKYITQLRLDRKIPGVDKFIVRSSFERLKLYIQIKKNFSFGNVFQVKKFI